MHCVAVTDASVNFVDSCCLLTICIQRFQPFISSLRVHFLVLSFHLSACRFQITF